MRGTYAARHHEVSHCAHAAMSVAFLSLAREYCCCLCSLFCKVQRKDLSHHSARTPCAAHYGIQTVVECSHDYTYCGSLLNRRVDVGLSCTMAITRPFRMFHFLCRVSSSKCRRRKSMRSPEREYLYLQYDLLRLSVHASL